MEFVGFIIVAAIFISIFFISGIVNEKKSKRLYIENLLKKYGTENKREYKPEEFQNISAYYRHHRTDFSIDDITWNDLNMDDVFRQMNFTKSSAGDEYLYFLLRNPKLKEMDYEAFEERVEYYQKYEKERVTLQYALHIMGHTGKYSIFDYLDHLNLLGKRSNKKIYLSYFILILLLVCTFYYLPIALMGIVVLLVFNLITYFKEKEKIDPYITSFSYVFRILNEVKTLQNAKIRLFEDEIEELLRIKAAFGKFELFSFLIMSPGRMQGNPIEILIDYLRMFLHLDILKFNSMYHEIEKHRDKISRMLEIIGYIDAILAIGEYREYLGTYCVPEYQEGEYEASNMYHPLLINPVKNSVSIHKSILITGSNASGKSTFLKMIAINTILAQSIHTVCADKYVADNYRVFTSLSLKDNIFDGDSFYMSEIKSIKRMLDAAKDKNTETKVLTFVDEVLRGTNTIERIAASGVILKSLSQCEGYCLAATHDIELTEILQSYFRNVHFEEEMKNGDIYFPYKLLEGKATTRNAIALLDLMGYANSITDMAAKQAQAFEQDGIWNIL